MHNITVSGYLAGYGVDFTHTFTRQFNQRVSVSFDTVYHDPTADFKVLVQCEPPELYYRFAGMVQSAHKNFDLILTYDDRLLELPNAQEFCPVGSWISDDLELNKIDQISYMMSSKVYTNAHRLRFMILRRFGHLKKLGQFDFIMHRSPPRIPSKDAFFANAKFNIACENQILPNMFTEKLLDCFRSRTVPLYFGCPNINKYFDPRGVITFQTVDELEHIVNALTPDDYESRLPYIEANYELGRPYWEQTVYQRIENLIAHELGL